MTLYATMLPRIGAQEPGGSTVIVGVPEGQVRPEGATYAVSLFSCGRLVATDDTPYMTNARSVMFAGTLPPADTVGPTVDFSVTVSVPGYDPYTLTATETMAERGLRTPACDAVEPADPDYDDPVVVSKASKAKTGTPRVGRKSTITATRFADVGAPVTEYLWFVGKKNLKTNYAAGGGRSIKVKPQWKGQPLFAVVHIYDANLGTDDATQVIKFGRVRR